MSEPVTQSEIEDVLSAVRKLVSENAGGEVKKAESASEDVSKLVLTPAFRVDDAAESRPKERAPETESQQATPGQGSAEDVTPEDIIAEVVEAAGDHEADVIALHSAPDATRQGDSQDEAPHDAETSQEAETAPASDTASQDESTADDLAARIAELEAVVGAANETAHEDYEPDGSEEQTLPSEALRPEEAAAADLMEDVVTAPEMAPEMAPESAPESAPEAQEQASEPASEWEDVDIDAETEGYTPQEPEMLEAEPYEDEDDEAASAAEMTYPEAASGPQPAPMPDPNADAAYVAEPEQDAAAGDDDDDMIIDEDMLREIVSRIVREELQGPMGERITQNLRRLVRREIQRALTMRGVE